MEEDKQGESVSLYSTLLLRLESRDFRNLSWNLLLLFISCIVDRKLR